MPRMTHMPKVVYVAGTSTVASPVVETADVAVKRWSVIVAVAPSLTDQGNNSSKKPTQI